MAATPLAAPSKLPLDRFLSLFADVQRDEGARLLLLAFNVFLILTAYYLMKPVREALILAQPGGAEIKSYSMALQAVLLAGIVPAYGALAGRLPRRRLINIVTAFFIACLPVFYLAAEAGWPVGIAFFLWIGIFSLMVIAQFWAYANDVYWPDAGKRLFAVVAFGASSGRGVRGVHLRPAHRRAGRARDAAGRRGRPGGEPDAVQLDRRAGAGPGRGPPAARPPKRRSATATRSRWCCKAAICC